MIKNYIKRKWDWVDRNPRLAVWISFFKGIIFGIVIMCLASCVITVKNPTKEKEQPLYETVHSEHEWMEILTPIQYRVLRQSSTERPFSSPLDKEKRSGLYVCAADSTQLFQSEDKFDSGTGWPSFDAAKNLEYKWDGRALEVKCITCGSHLGHLFKDEKFTEKNLRYCINGVALRFIAD